MNSLTSIDGKLRWIVLQYLPRLICIHGLLGSSGPNLRRHNHSRARHAVSLPRSNPRLRREEKTPVDGIFSLDPWIGL